MNENKNEKRQRRIIISLLLLIIFLLVFILVLLLRKPQTETPIEPRGNDTQEVIDDRSSKQVDDKEKEVEPEKEDKKEEKIVIKRVPQTPTQPQEEWQDTPSDDGGGGHKPTPTPAKQDGKIETNPEKIGTGSFDYEEGVSHQLISEGSTSTGTMMYCATKSSTTPIDSLFNTTVPSVEDAGHYYVWYYSKGNSTHKDTDKEYIEVYIGSPSVIATNPTFKTNVIHNGAYQTVLLTEGSSVQGTSQTGTFKYYASTSNTTVPDKNLFTTDGYKVKDVGEYYIWYYLEGKKGYYDVEPSTSLCSEKITVTSRTKATAVAPTPKDDLAYIKGSQQVLITPANNSTGDPSTGVMKYCVTDASVTTTPAYNTFGYTNDTLPSKTQAGKYKVWYYTEGTLGEYDNSDVGCVEVEIRQIRSEIKMAPHAITEIVGLVVADGSPKVLISTLNSEADTAFEYSFDKVNWSTALPTGIEPDSYRIWYRASGNVNYLPSLNPSFIEVTISNGKAKFIEPVAIQGISYDGNPHELINKGSSDDGEMVYYVTDSTSLPPEKESFDKDYIFGTNAKSYKIWYYVKGDSKHEDSEIYYVNNKILSSAAEVLVAPTAIKGLSFNNSNQELVTAGSSSSGSMRYFVTTDPSKIPTKDEFQGTVPTGKQSGDYYVWYYAGGNANLGDSPICSSAIEVTMGKIAAAYTSEPTPVATFTYDGNKHPIANAGSTNEGNILFKVTNTPNQPSTSEEGWGKNIPEESDAGTYYVWYYIKGDSSHNDSLVSGFTVTIDKAPGIIKQKPKELNPTYQGLNSPLTLAEEGNSSTGTMLYYVTTDDSMDDDRFNLLKSNTDEYTGFIETIDTKVYKGTYYIFFYSKGDNNHLDTNYDKVVSTIRGEDSVPEMIAPKGVTFPWTGTTWQLIDSSPHPSYNHQTIKYAVTTDITKGMPEKQFFSSSVPLAKECGKYYVWYYFEGNGAGTIDTDVSYVISYIKNQAQIISDPQLVGGRNDNTIVLKESSMKPINAGYAEGGNFVYYLYSGEDSWYKDTPDKELYTEEIPHVNSIGKYRLFYYVKGNETHTDSDYRDIQFTVLGEKAKFVIYPTLKDGLDDGSYIYNEKFNPIENAGTVNAGSPRFCVINLDKGAYVPYFGEFTTYDNLNIEYPGKYRLYYYVDANPNDDYYVSFTYDTNDYEWQDFIVGKQKSQIVVPPSAKNDSSTRSNSRFELLNINDMVTTPNAGSPLYAITLTNEAPLDNQYSKATPIAGIGHYYVWVKLSENENYAESDPVCVEVTISGIAASVTAPKAIDNLVYNGVEQVLITAGSTSAGTMKYALVPAADNVNPMVSPSLLAYKESLPTAKMPGLYYVWFKSDGQTAAEQTAGSCIAVEIKKADQIVSAAPEVNDDLLADGSDISILKSSAVSTSGEVEYYVSLSNDTPKDDVTWVSYDAVFASNPGIYYVWYRGKETSAYNATDCDYVVAIVQTEGKMEVEPVLRYGSEIPYKDSAIYPLIEGESSTGTIKYGLGGKEDQPTEYYSHLQTLTDMGEYYIWYYSESNQVIYKDTEPKLVYVRIVKGKAEITQKPEISGSTKFDSYVEVPYTDGSISIVDGIASHGEVKYAIVDDPSQFESAIFVSINELATPISLGTHYFGYKAIAEDTEHFDDGKYECIEIHVVRGQADATTPDANTGIADGVNEIALLSTPSNATYGVVEYAVSFDPIHIPDMHLFSEQIPQVKFGGKYYVWFYATGDDNHSPSAPACIEVNIQSGDYEVPTVTAISGLKCNDTEQALVETSYSGGTMYYAVGSAPETNPDNITSTAIPTGNHPGDYVVSYYYDFNSDGTIKSDIYYVYAHIDYKDCLIKEAHKPTPARDLTYDTKSQNLWELTPKDGYTYRYYMTQDPNEVPSVGDIKDEGTPQATDAGNYYIWWYAFDSSGIYAPIGPERIEAFIGMKIPTYDNISWNYISDVKEVDNYSVPVYPDYQSPSSNDGTALYYVTDDPSTLSSAIANKYSGFTTNPTVSTPGIYYCYYFILGDGRNIANTTIGCFSFNASSIYVNINEPSINNDLFYNSKKLPLLINYNADPGEWVFAIGDENVVPPMSSFAPGVPTAINPGTYYVYAYVRTPGGLQYNDIKKYICTINKGEPYFISSPFAKSNLVETDNEPFELIDPAVVEGNRVVEYLVMKEQDYYANNGSYDPNDFSTDIPTAFEPGVYMIFYRIKEDNYYKGSENFDWVNVTIEPEGKLPTGFREKMGGPMYNGQEQVVANPGQTSLGYYEYALSTTESIPSESEFDRVMPTVVNAGNYYLFYRKHYNSGKIGSISYVDSRINPKPTSMKTDAVANEGLIYDGNEKELFSTLPTTEDGYIAYLVSPTEIPAEELLSEESLMLLTFEPAAYDYIASEYGEEMAQILSQIIPFGTPKATEAGDHYVYYIALPETYIYFLLNGDFPVGVPINYTVEALSAIKCKIVSITKNPCAIEADPSDVETSTLVWNNGEPITLINNDGQCNVGDFVFAVTYENIQPDKSAFKKYTDVKPVGYNVGTYYVWYCVTAGDLYEDSEVKCREVNISGDGPVLTRPVARTNPRYADGNPVQLLFEPASVQSGDNKFIKYAVKSDLSDVPVANDYKNELPTATYPGKYYIWYLYSDGDSVSTNPEYITANVIKGIAKITKAPQVLPSDELYIYDEEPYNQGVFITAGESNGGTIMYAFTTVDKTPDLSEFSPNLPVITVPYYNYYFYYYIDGGEYYESTEPVLISREPAFIEQRHKDANRFISPTRIPAVRANGNYVALVEGGKAPRGYEFVYCTYHVDNNVDNPDVSEYTVDGYKGIKPGVNIVHFAFRDIITNEIEGNYAIDVDLQHGFLEFDVDPLPNDQISYQIKDQEVQLLKENTGTVAYSEAIPMYYVTDDPSFTPTQGDFDPKLPVATTPGTKYVWYYLLSKDGLMINSEFDFFQVEVEKLDAGVIQAPVLLDNIKYDSGDPVPLVGSYDKANDCGTPMYYVSTQNICPPLSLFKQVDDAKEIHACDPGTYYIWYYVKGDEYHKDSIPQNIPVTVDGEGPEVPFIRPYDEFQTSYEYGGFHKFITQQFVSSGKTYYYCTTDPIVPDIGNYYEDYTSIGGDNAGDYYIWYYAFSQDGTKQSVPNYVVVTIEKANVDITAPTVATDLVHVDSPVTLIDAGHVGTDQGQLKYAVSKFNSCPNLDKFTTQLPTVDEAGTYYVWYYATGDHNHNSYGPILMNPIIVSQSTTLPDKLPQALHYDFDNFEHPLVSAGRSSRYEYLYWLSNDDTNYNPENWWFESNIPVKREPGVYRVWYIERDKTNSDNINRKEYLVCSISEYGTIMEYPLPASPLVWTGSPISLISKDYPGKSGDGNVLFTEPTLDSNTTYSILDVSSFNLHADQVQASDVGTYYVWYMLVNDNVGKTNPVRLKITISGIGVSEIIPEAVVNDNLRIVPGKNQGPIFKTVPKANNGSIKYAFVSSGDTPENYDIMPDQLYTSTYWPGLYDFYYYAEGSNGYSNSEVKCIKDIEISKGKVTILDTPKINNPLTFTIPLIESDGVTDISSDEGVMFKYEVTVAGVPLTKQPGSFADLNKTGMNANAAQAIYSATGMTEFDLSYYVDGGDRFESTPKTKIHVTIDTSK